MLLAADAWDASAALAGASTASEVAGPLASLDDQIGLYRHGLLVQNFVPAEDTDVARGVALRTALATAQDGDEIILGAYTFDMGGLEHVEFPDRVTVTGAGKELTKLTSSCSQAVDPAATFTLNHETVIQDLWLEGSLYDGSFQPLVGMQGGPVEDVTAYLRRLKITGDSDGIFLWTGTIYNYTIYAYDCDIITRFDAVATIGSGPNPQTIKLYNCTLTVSQPSAIPWHMSNAVNAHTGFVGLYNCTVNVIGDADSEQTVGVWTRNNGAAQVVDTTFNVSAPSGMVYDLLIDDETFLTVMGGQGSGPAGEYVSSTGTELYRDRVPSTVREEYVFYNNSRYDDRQPRPGGHDSGAAIATDKTPLLPDSGPASFSNIISYSKGINGIIIDLGGVHGSVTADDFLFRVGNNNSPSTWQAAPAPASVTVYGQAGEAFSDRVEVIWDDNAIQKTWLEVTLLANGDTGLGVPETFYFGNAFGDSGMGDTAKLFTVDITDQLQARNNPATLPSNVPITNIRDYNRDGIVDITDELIARNNVTNAQTATRILDFSVQASLGEESLALELTSEADEPLAAVAAALVLTPPLAAPAPRLVVEPLRAPIYDLASTPRGDTVAIEDSPRARVILEQQDRIRDADEDWLEALLAGRL